MDQCKLCQKEILPCRKTGLCKTCYSHQKKSPEVIKAISNGKLSDKNPMWRGDNVGYDALHDWVKRRLKKPAHCQQCGKEAKLLDLANISNEYKRDLSDWEWLCRRCHMHKDGRINGFLSHKKSFQKGHKIRVPEEKVLKGENHPMCRLTENEVLEIRKRYATGNYTQPRLAEEYKTTFKNISLIVLRKNWKHI